MKCLGNFEDPKIIWQLDQISVKCKYCDAVLSLPIHPVDNGSGFETPGRLKMVMEWAAYKRWKSKFSGHGAKPTSG